MIIPFSFKSNLSIFSHYRIQCGAEKLYNAECLLCDFDKWRAEMLLNITIYRHKLNNKEFGDTPNHCRTQELIYAKR